MRIIGKLLGLVIIIFLLWVIISIYLGIGSGIINMPAEDGGPSIKENWEQTAKPMIKEAWENTEIDTIINENKHN